MDEDNKKLIEYLEAQGALVLEGMDETGEAIFRFDLEILKTVMPQIYDEIMKEIDEDLMNLYSEGLVDVEYDEDLTARFKISEKGERMMNHKYHPDFPLQD